MRPGRSGWSGTLTLRQRLGRDWFPGAMLAAVLLVLTACGGAGPAAPLPPQPFPSPPEPARFYYERSVYGTADVESVSDEERLRELLTGASRASGTRFSKPFDVAVHRGRVFVSDTVARVVFALDFAEGRSFRIGDKGDDGDLAKPLGIAVDGQGRLYVVDGNLRRVTVYDRSGRFRSAFGGKDVLDRPTGIAVSRDGSRAYVVDVGGVRSENHRIHVFDPRNGRLVHQIGSRGKQEGEFNLPRDVTIGRDGRLYVSDGGNFRVQVLSVEGDFIRAWGKAGLRFGQFSRPKGIATDPEGNVYVVDTAFGNFQIFTPEGQLLLFVGRRSETNGPAVFMLPAGIDVDEDGRIYVVDQFFNKLEIIRPAMLTPDEGYLAGRPRAAAPPAGLPPATLPPDTAGAGAAAADAAPRPAGVPGAAAAPSQPPSAGMAPPAVQGPARP